jgi:hypothetical protein
MQTKINFAILDLVIAIIILAATRAKIARVSWDLDSFNLDEKKEPVSGGSATEEHSHVVIHTTMAMQTAWRM